MANLDLRPVVDDPLTPLASPPLLCEASPVQKWRVRRNLVIYMAHRQGLSYQVIADAFGLTRCSVRSVIRNLSAEDDTDVAEAGPRDPSAPAWERLRNASPARRRRCRRDLVVRLLHSNGLSQRTIADALKVPRSVIGTILK